MVDSNHAVFLSYASEDAPAALRLAAALREAGIDVWFDRDELRGGDAWDLAIRERIRSCRLFVPVLSARASARDEGYFRREWRLAIERAGDMADGKAFLVPVVIDALEDAAARVPERFRSVQWTRLPEGHATPAFVARIGALLGAPDATASPPAGGRPAVAPLPPRAPWRRPLVLAAILLALVAVIAATQLGRLRGATAAPAVKSIAVLPFNDLSETHDLGYFSDGLAAELIDELTRVHGLRVTAQTSSFRFRGPAPDLRAIGKALDVAYVLEGSVRRSGQHLRVTAELVRIGVPSFSVQ